MTTYERIERLVLDSGVHKRNVRSTLARICGISPQAVAAWDTGDTKKISPEYLVLIGAEYNVSVEYLVTGVHPAGLNKLPANSMVSGAVQELNKLGKGHGLIQTAMQLPILNSTQAISPAKSIAAGDIEGLLGVPPAMNLGGSAFYYRLDDDSMFSTERQLFRKGTMVVIDPDGSIEPGVFVLARISEKGADTAVFRAFFEREPMGEFDSFDLVPINKAVRTIRVKEPGQAEIIGVLAGVYTPASDIRFG